MTPTDAYPLTWPAGWPRTPGNKRQRAKFGKSKQVYRPDGTPSYRSKGELTITQACDRLLEQLEMMGVNIDGAVVSSNVSVRLDGLPMSKQRLPDDPGVAIYFTLKGEPMCLPCDRWDRVADNLAAVAAHLDAMRGMERWGVGSTAQHFAGFKALPPAGGTTVGADGPPWWVVLGLVGMPDKHTLEDAKKAYRRLAAELHPDRIGGDGGRMAMLNRAWEQAQALLGETVLGGRP